MKIINGVGFLAEEEAIARALYREHVKSLGGDVDRMVPFEDFEYGRLLYSRNQAKAAILALIQTKAVKDGRALSFPR